MTGRPIIAAAAVVALGLLLASLPLGLSGDVQYVLGGLRVHDADSPFGFVDTFTHRPIAYRAVMSGLTDLVGLVGIDEDALGPFEGALRFLAVVLACLTGLALWRALRDRIGHAEGVAVGVAVAVALAIAPNFDFLQPEWFAALFLALGVAAGIGLRNEWAAAALAGALLTLAVAVKLATAPLAIAGVLLILLLDRRRAWLTVVAGVMWGAVWLLLVAAAPTEWRWMRDMVALNPNSPLRAGLGADDVVDTLVALASKAAVSPVVLVAPAGLVILTRTVADRRHRPGVAMVLLLVLGLTVAPLVAQGQSILYHLAALPVLSAAIVAVAAVRWWRLTGRPPWVLLAPLTVAGLAATLLLSAPADWRTANSPWLVAVLVMVVLVLVAASLFVPLRREPSAGGTFLAISAAGHGGLIRTVAGLVVVAVVSVLPVVAPSAAWSLDPVLNPYTNAGWASRSSQAREAFEAMSVELGRDTKVLYLSYGDIAYHLGNPTDCRYPSPLWIQRSAFFRYVVEFFSYRDNVACIGQAQAGYAVIQPGWLRTSRLPGSPPALIEATFDCADAREAMGTLACVRR